MRSKNTQYHVLLVHLMIKTLGLGFEAGQLKMLIAILENKWE
jgi:hypothetical protein